MPHPGLLHPEPLPLKQATADPYLFRRHSNPQRQVWLSVCGVSWCAQGFVCVPQEFPQSVYVLAAVLLLLLLLLLLLSRFSGV